MVVNGGMLKGRIFQASKMPWDTLAVTNNTTLTSRHVMYNVYTMTMLLLSVDGDHNEIEGDDV